MDQLYGMFNGPRTNAMPGVLFLDGTNTRLTVWRQGLGPVEFTLPRSDGHPHWGHPQWIHGRLHDGRDMTLWGFNPFRPEQDKNRTGDAQVRAATANPWYGVEGKFNHDCDRVSAVEFVSPHLEIELSATTDASEVPATTNYGTLTVTTDRDWSGHGDLRPITRLRLDFPEPVPFEAEGQRRLVALLFLCEALTGRSHNFDGSQFKVPNVHGEFRLHDFHDSGEEPDAPQYGQASYPHVDNTEILSVGAKWLNCFLAPESNYPEIFSHFSQSLAGQDAYDRLRVFQSVNAFDLFPDGALSQSLDQRIKRVAKAIDGLGMHQESSFTSDNLRKFRQWGVDMRDRVAHGPRNTKGKEILPRPAYCDDPRALGYVCNTLEFVLALSTLIECGLDFHQWYARSQPQGRNKFRDVTFQFEKMVSHIEALASPAVTSSAGKAGS